MFLTTFIYILIYGFPFFVVVSAYKHFKKLNGTRRNAFDRFSVSSLSFIACVIASIISICYEFFVNEDEEPSMITPVIFSLTQITAILTFGVYVLEFDKQAKIKKETGSQFYANGGLSAIYLNLILLFTIVTGFAETLIPRLIDYLLENADLGGTVNGVVVLLSDPDLETKMNTLSYLAPILSLVLCYFVFNIRKHIKAETLPETKTMLIGSIVGSVIMLIDSYLWSIYLKLAPQPSILDKLAIVFSLVMVGIVWCLYVKAKNPIAIKTGTAKTEKPSDVQDQSHAPQRSKTDQLLELKGLLDAGILTQEEFDEQKYKIIN